MKSLYAHKSKLPTCHYGFEAKDIFCIGTAKLKIGPDFEEKDYRLYRFLVGGFNLMWSSLRPIPEIGTRVYVNCNSLGNGQVVAYFYEHGFLGVEVELDKATQPDWHWKQNQHTHCLVYGLEIEDERK